MNGLEKTNPNRNSISNVVKITFGTSGWRGIISDDFTSANVALVTQAIANYLKRQGPNRSSASHVASDTKAGVIVGYDTRFMSDRFARISANVLQQNNIPVLFTKRDTPTPVIAFHIVKHKAEGGINITASHNPPEYNGIKFSTAYGGPAPSEVTTEIEKEIARLQNENIDIHYSQEPGKWKIFDPRPEYIKHMGRMIDLNAIKKSKLKVIVNCLYGTSRGYLDYILNETGINVTVINNTINPDFGGASPCPSEDHLKDLSKMVVKNKANLGLATDGDADRFGIIDKDGTFLQPNSVLALFTEHLLKTRKHKGGIVRSMTTTRLLDAISKKFGREIYEVPVGFKYVATALLEHNALMGCEESGGMTISGHVPEKDGILACLLMTELVAHRKKSLREILKEIEKEYGAFYSTRVDAELTQENKEKLLSQLKNNPFKEFTGIKVSHYSVLPGDIVKMELVDRSWIIIRPSGTEPIVRCYCETNSAKKLSVMEKELRQMVN